MGNATRFRVLPNHVNLKYRSVLLRNLHQSIATIHAPTDLRFLPGSIVSGMPRLSGLQKDVLALYRRCLRATRVKPVGRRPHFVSFARREFEKHLDLDKKDFGAIEFLLRKGDRQLEMYSAPNITNIAG